MTKVKRTVKALQHVGTAIGILCTGDSDEDLIDALLEVYNDACYKFRHDDDICRARLEELKAQDNWDDGDEFVTMVRITQEELL